jgi:hypothetical protein
MTEQKIEHIPEHTAPPSPDQRPSVGRIAHYVSHGSPVLPDGSQRYGKECRAALITEIDGADPYRVCLFVANPTGAFFKQGVLADFTERQGGTWHWPERV